MPKTKKNNEPTYNGTLFNAEIIKNWRNTGADVVVGEVYNDSKGRFPDGTTMRTSQIVSIDKDNNVVHTLNSHYKINNWNS